MTDEETLAEIERQEKRFADAGFGRGLRLAHSAREYSAEMMETRRRALAAEEECREAEREISELMAAKEREEAEARRHWARAKRHMSDVFDLRKVLKGGASLKKQEHFARLKLDEKIVRLQTMPID